MPADMRIELNVVGAQQAQAILNQLAGAVQGIQGAQGRGRGGGGGGGGAGGGGAGGGGGRRPADFATRLNRFISSTRFGAGNASPLIGRALDLIGIRGAAAGPVALAAGAAAAGLIALAHATQATIERMQEFSQVARETGGTAGNIGRLAGMGISPAEMSSASAALHEASPLARQQLGLGPAMPGPFGEVNRLKDVQTAIATLKTKSAEEQLRWAREAGVTSLLKYVRVSKQTQRVQEQIAADTERIFDQQHMQAADELAVNMEVLQQAMLNFAAALTKDVIPAITTAIQGATGVVSTLSNVNWGTIFKNLALAFVPGMGVTATGNILAELMQAYKRAADAAQAQADATKANTSAIKALNEGIFGGGELARAAIGAGMKGEYLNRALDAGALRLGAFRL